METSKAKEKIVKASDFLSKNGKSMLIGAAVLGGLIIIYKIYKNFSGKNKTEEEREREQQIKGVVNQPVNLKNTTITEQEAKNLAQQLLSAMDYAAPLYGTDEKTILAVFKKIKTSDDFILIFNAFGMKEYNGNGLPPTSSFGRMFDVFEPRDLVYWLKEELSPTDGEVYRVVKNVVEQSGFTF